MPKFERTPPKVEFDTDNCEVRIVRRKDAQGNVATRMHVAIDGSDGERTIPVHADGAPGDFLNAGQATAIEAIVTAAVSKTLQDKAKASPVS